MRRIALARLAHELRPGRVDELAPFAAVEDAVVADAFLLQVAALGGGDVAAEVVGGLGLAEAGDVVELAFDRHQRGLADRGGLHLLAAVGEGADRQRMLLEHVADGVEIEIRRQVHDREILVVEAPVPRGALAVAHHQVMEEIDVRLHVAVRVHGHEAAELQEAGIDPPHRARIVRRHQVDHLALEPVEALAGADDD